MARARVVVSLFVFGLLACGGGSSDEPPSAPDGGGSSTDAAPGGADAAASADADPTLGGGTLTGNVTRSAAPAAGGRGNIYIAVFTTDPVADRDNAVNVGGVIVEDVDMSADDASIPYMLTGVPPRAEPYFVTAFLDDNGTADPGDPSAAGPDRGDLLALDGLASPKVTVSSETTVPFDIDLNFNLPF